MIVAVDAAVPDVDIGITRYEAKPGVVAQCNVEAASAVRQCAKANGCVCAATGIIKERFETDCGVIDRGVAFKRLDTERRVLGANVPIASA